MPRKNQWHDDYSQLSPGDVFVVEHRDAEYVVISNTFHEGKGVDGSKEPDTYIIQTNQGVLIYDVGLKHTYRKYKIIVFGMHRHSRSIYIGKK